MIQGCVKALASFPSSWVVCNGIFKCAKRRSANDGDAAIEADASPERQAPGKAEHSMPATSSPIKRALAQPKSSTCGRRLVRTSTWVWRLRLLDRRNPCCVFYMLPRSTRALAPGDEGDFGMKTDYRRKLAHREAIIPPSMMQ